MILAPAYSVSSPASHSAHFNQGTSGFAFISGSASRTTTSGLPHFVHRASDSQPAFTVLGSASFQH